MGGWVGEWFLVKNCKGDMETISEWKKIKYKGNKKI